MPNTASVTMHRDFKRLSRDFVEAISHYPSGYFVDIQNRRGSLDHSIQPIFPSKPVYGSAVTVKTVPDDNLAPYAALKVLQPGDVLVIGNGGWTGSSVIGDLIAGMFKNAGVAAIVTDGLVRDAEGLEQVGIPVFARGLSANSPQKFGPGEVGGDVVIGGVHVRTGDLIIGSRDGVVCLGAEHLAMAKERLERIRLKESHIEELIAKGMSSPQWIQDLFSADGVTYID